MSQYVLKASSKTAKTKPIGLVKEIVLIDSHPKAAEKIQMDSNARQKEQSCRKRWWWFFFPPMQGGSEELALFLLSALYAPLFKQRCIVETS